MIRPVALAVIKRGSDLLVFQAVEHATQETFYRPLGGGIEFGETAEAALRRELREELAAELTDVRLMDVLENIFQLNGRAGHEIVFVFAADLVDRTFYDRDHLGTVLDGTEPVSWQPLASFVAKEARLYPATLPRLLGIAD